MSTPVPQPGILNINPYVGGKASAEGGRKVAKLSANESPLGPSPKAIEAVEKTVQDMHRYPDGGAEDLTAAIAEVHGLEADRIICGNGSDEIISLLISAYVGVGDEVLYPEHGFLMYPISTHAAGGTPVAAAETNRTTDVNTLLAAVTERTKILFLANPNNPTGTYLPFSEIERLRAGLRDDVLLVLDAAYAEYVMRDDYRSGAELVESHDNVVMTRTFSKIYGLSALRIGWGYCPPEIADVLHRIRGPFNTNALAQVAAVAAVRDQDHVDKARAHNDKWLPILTQGFRGMGLEITPSVGNFLLIDFAGSGKTAAEAEKYLTGLGLLLRAVAGYGLPSCLRMSIGTDDENHAVLDALRAFLDK
ncbi:histidinol-phosphate transaminase [Sneathiella marina]|uniref:Histidinol-phosphate aminotransferase n=1 Tax=Sneathiella marina TaxID=2950108 RepID=A0ABY4W1P8_9PROT|nr:histidinol-phosphate transaminase [Sneathiella marina]USG61080.1 histidinol-phosphate transaminase [Sneathiella marina]